MAGLKKPTNCQCGGVLLHREYSPERWICDGCGTVVRSRQKKPNTNSCRECGAPRDSKPFKKGKNFCMDCYNDYMRAWRKNNPDHWREYRSRPDVKQRLQANVRKAVQRSPEAFIRNLWHSINKRRAKYKTGKKMVKQGKLNPACLDVQIDFDYLWALWEDQGGKCAISGMEMLHQFNSLESISIDRIDSGEGYVPGNVQLVCRWVNLAKQRHTNEEFLGLLDAYYEGRRLRDADLMR